jgi:hypothetical protein
MARLTRRLVFTVMSVVALLGLPSTAFAMPAPIVPDTGVSDQTPVIIERVTSTPSTTLWQLALVALVAALGSAVVVVLLTRLTGAARRTHPQPA